MITTSQETLEVVYELQRQGAADDRLNEEQWRKYRRYMTFRPAARLRDIMNGKDSPQKYRIVRLITKTQTTSEVVDTLDYQDEKD